MKVFGEESPGRSARGEENCHACGNGLEIRTDPEAIAKDREDGQQQCVSGHGVTGVP